MKYIQLVSLVVWVLVLSPNGVFAQTVICKTVREEAFSLAEGIAALTVSINDSRVGVARNYAAAAGGPGPGKFAQQRFREELSEMDKKIFNASAEVREKLSRLLSESGACFAALSQGDRNELLGFLENGGKVPEPKKGTSNKCAQAHRDLFIFGGSFAFNARWLAFIRRAEAEQYDAHARGPGPGRLAQQDYMLSMLENSRAYKTSLQVSSEKFSDLRKSGCFGEIDLERSKLSGKKRPSKDAEQEMPSSSKRGE